MRIDFPLFPLLFSEEIQKLATPCPGVGGVIFLTCQCSSEP